MVRIPSLKELSKSLLEIVNNKVIENNEIIKIIIVRKYLLISDLIVLESDKCTLFL
tara:strand:+ start:210 stop:377 length:168 start_codon:yes stop_codon:yes gene_type:complete